ncbi:5'-nucleotidase C-terminal domain-containing protein [Runella limosa]|uniref:5'-nucleotidase C-terminal domain-containing protein n=1 Tax=Runella limosa TaxID=370978 RepID=UPI000425F928|nr:5'-nucleotidase C-terminal domain-containing protein [Runella limosa]
MRKIVLPLALLALSLGACTRYFVGKPVKLQPIAISDTVTAPSSALSQTVDKYLKPYHDSLDAQMTAVLTTSPRRLTKGTPESELGNLMADLFREMGQERFGKPIDVAVTNNGGIRTDLPQGNITLGKVYEVMPFDNDLVVLTLSGATMQKVIDFLAQRKEPQSGLKLVVDKATNKPKEVLIGGKPLNTEQTYTLITSDYMAMSSDLAPIVKNNQGYKALNYLMRDAMADYLRRKGKQGQAIDPKKDGRTTVVE